MSELDYKEHRKKFESFLQSPNAETQEHFNIEALSSHANVIQIALTKMAISSQSILLKNNHARNYYMYGFCRRVLMLSRSFNNIWLMIPVDRIEPLINDDANIVNGDLNLVYLNIRGCLDNLLRSYLHEREGNLTDKLKDRDIYLFNSELIKKTQNEQFWKSLSTYEKWYRELKEKRDPVAHKMPLYVIPSIYGNGDIEHCNNFYEKYQKAISTMKLDEAKKEFDKIEKLGKFVPLFAHAPDQLYEIYPTIPQDIGKLIEIFNIVKNEFTN